MEFLITRYRNLTVLLLVIFAQLVLLAYQVKSNQDIRLIRVWAVTVVTPLARVLEFVREHTIGVVERYVVLVNVRDQNEKLRDELGRLKIENHFLKTELETADRAQALAAFQARTPSRTIAARIIGTGTGASSRVVFIDRGSSSGILRGMAVITPDGIVGKVLASYPTASQVLLITDPTFAAGVISDRNRVHGTVKGTGESKVIVDYVQNEEKVEPGEIFYTSGDDRIFPKGMPVGRVTVVRPGKTFREIYVVPSGFQQGLEEVLIVIEGVHGTIPDPQTTAAASGVYLMPPAEPAKPQPGAAPGRLPSAADSAAAPLSTEADRLRERYKKIGEAQGVTFGEGHKIPNFNIDPDAAKRAPTTSGSETPGASGSPAPAAGSTGAAKPSAPPKPSSQSADRPGLQDSGPSPAVRPSSPAENSAPVPRR